MSQAAIDQAMQIAVGHHQAGRFGEAEAVYRQVLAGHPNHPDALNLLGVLAAQFGQHEMALELMRKATAAAPENPDYYYNLASVLQEQGRLDEAIAAYQQTLALRPDYAEAHNNLGNCWLSKGQPGPAIGCYQQALSLRPDLSQAHNNLGNAFLQTGQLDAAIGCFGRALEITPDYVEAHYNLGNAFKNKGDFDQAVAGYQAALILRPDYLEAHINLGNVFTERGLLDAAIGCYEQAITLKPDHAEARLNLGSVLYEKGRFDEAIDCLQKALEVKADSPQAWNILGSALQNKGRVGDAISCYDRALALKPDYPQANYNLGNAWKEKGGLDEAIAFYQRAIALKPDLARAYNNLGNCLSDAGRLDEAITSFGQAVKLDPAFVDAHDNLLFSFHYHPDYDAKSLFAQGQIWNRQYAVPLQKLIRPHDNDRNPDRRLRIGYVSPDFREHPVGRFLLPLLASHDRDRFEIFCYSHVQIPDEMTAKLQAHAHVWRETTNSPEEILASKIREDQIDILVDLSGHSSHNRLLVFARKPAPLQIAYLGYPGTTGMNTIDYRLTDALADPPGLADPFYCETLIRLPHIAWCFEAPELGPPVGDLPAMTNGYVTFGSFNNLIKVNDSVLNLWAKILHSVSMSKLLIKAKGLGCASVQERIRQFMSRSGIESDRLELSGPVSLADHLALYNRVDIALDTFPYQGTTTTCESLWMGTPVVSLSGQTHVSRVGTSLLTNIGLPELIAESQEEYIKVATDLAADLPRLAELRRKMRDRMRSSPLMDAGRFAHDVEAAYRQMWHAWCMSKSQ